MKHKAPNECVPVECVNGQCPIALRNDYGSEASGVDWDFTCKDCYHHIEYCEDCEFWYDCKSKGRIK